MTIKAFTRYQCSGCGVFNFQEGSSALIPEGWTSIVVRHAMPGVASYNLELCPVCYAAFVNLQEDLRERSPDPECVSDGSPYR